MRTGFQVKSVQQVLCITKLAYYNQGKRIAELSKYVDPQALVAITEKTLAESVVNLDDPEWFEYLSAAYTEVYAQWFDSLGEAIRGDALKGWDNFIVAENKNCPNTRERNIVSALNIIGTSINRASKMTAIATREEFRNHKAHDKILYYARVDKEQLPEKMWSKRLNASNLPWKHFGDYARSNFAEGSEYDDGNMKKHWEKRLI